MCEASPQAVEKFKMALALEPSRHDVWWCLGNAYTSQARSSTVASNTEPAGLDAIALQLFGLGWNLMVHPGTHGQDTLLSKLLVIEMSHVHIC